ncbi:hypothetical protein CBP35_19760 (plasmid) [Acidovorax carolinensis]|uniref:hypothetical protein n=1 Tax=Acidovorax carolinensis TaxID=553814 RepID=UPI000B5E95CF|nr:hypothetical protein [Acidovorax carolinensis]ART57152.1 hypothetical protein CBP35_19760 [Acidovorax carolinensis]
MQDFARFDFKHHAGSNLHQRGITGGPKENRIRGRIRGFPGHDGVVGACETHPITRLIHVLTEVVAAQKRCLAKRGLGREGGGGYIILDAARYCVLRLVEFLRVPAYSAAPLHLAQSLVSSLQDQRKDPLADFIGR